MIAPNAEISREELIYITFLSRVEKMHFNYTVDTYANCTVVGISSCIVKLYTAR
jgi:hypothetical protein